MKFLFIDDDLFQRSGYKTILEERFPGSVVETHSFDTAERITSLHAVDYVFVDLHLPQTSRPEVDEFPGVKAVQRLTKLRGAGSRRPYLIVVTANVEAFHRPAIRRRLLQANCEFFVRREVLAEHLEQIITPHGPPDELISPSVGGIEARVRLDQTRSEISAGKYTLSPAADLNGFAQLAVDLKILKGRVRGAGDKQRDLNDARALLALEIQGRARQPGVRAIRDFWRSIGRISRGDY